MAPDEVKCERANRLDELVSIAIDEQEQNISNGQSENLPKNLVETCEKQQQQLRFTKYGACEVKPTLFLGQIESVEKVKGQSSKHVKESIRRKQSVNSATSGSSGGLPTCEHLLMEEKPAFIERLAKIIPGLGIILALCASVFLGTAGMLVKLTTSVHGIQVAVFSVRKVGWLPERSEFVPTMLRAILGGASITFSYYALKLIPLGDATTIRFSLPIWTMIMSYFFLRESCSLFKVSAVLISIAGVVLIAKPDECVYLMHVCFHWLHLESESDFLLHARHYEQERVQELAALVASDLEMDASALVQSSLLVQFKVDNLENSTSTLANSSSSSNQSLSFKQEVDSSYQPIGGLLDPLRQFEGCMMALASSICLSLSLIAQRLCKRTPAEISILWLSNCSIIIGSATLLLLNKWRLPNNWLDVIYILLNGLCGSAGQWFITSALKVEQSGIIALARTFDIEIAFLYSALLLNEPIRITSIMGSLLVSLGVIIVIVPKWFSCSSSQINDDDDQVQGEGEETRSEDLDDSAANGTETSDAGSSVLIADRHHHYNQTNNCQFATNTNTQMPSANLPTCQLATKTLMTR